MAGLCLLSYHPTFTRRRSWDWCRSNEFRGVRGRLNMKLASFLHLFQNGRSWAYWNCLQFFHLHVFPPLDCACCQAHCVDCATPRGSVECYAPWSRTCIYTVGRNFTHYRYIQYLTRKYLPPDRVSSRPFSILLNFTRFFPNKFNLHELVVWKLSLIYWLIFCYCQRTVLDRYQTI